MKYRKIRWLGLWSNNVSSFGRARVTGTMTNNMMTPARANKIWLNAARKDKGLDEYGRARGSWMGFSVDGNTHTQKGIT